MTKFDFGVRRRPNDFYPLPDSILEGSFIPRFEEMVAKYPDFPAIESGELRLTYRALNNAVNALARSLDARSGNEQAPVAFLLRDEVYSIVAILAILKTGRFFAGLHPSLPSEQVKSFWADSTARILIAAPEFRPLVSALPNATTIFFDRLETEADLPNPAHVPNRARDPFAIFYTSGSTGQPKGVLSTHDLVNQMIWYMTNEWYFSHSDRISLFTSVCFLAAYPSFLGALLNGGTLCMLDLKTHSAQAALDWIVDTKLTVFRSTPSIFRTIFGQADTGRVFPLLRLLTLGGEPVNSGDIELFKAHTAEDCVLINNLAATEINLISHNPVTHATPAFEGSLPAGFPAPGKEFFIVDDDGQIVKPGEVGEIVVRARYRSLGYWRQPELTAQKFHSDPDHPDMELYFTADRGRVLENGALEVLGRHDTQVKIRGYRVQLEAIDLALRSFPGVMDAATVVARSKRGGGERLAAYVCLAGDEKLSVSALRNYLSERIAGYMIPSVFVQVASLPRTATGKLARRQLPEPSSARPDIDTPYVAPRADAERRIAAIWERTLDVDGVGVDDNFFELGGDSLMALEMTLEVERALGANVPAAAFANPTIASLALALGEEAMMQEAEEKFILASFRKAEQDEAQAGRRPDAKWSKLASHSYSWRDAERVFDQIVARYIVAKPYAEAKRWILKWSHNTLALNLFYRGRRAMFSHFLGDLNDCQMDADDAFSMCILSNLNFGLLGRLGNDWRAMRNDVGAAARARSTYWRDVARSITNATDEQLAGNFPIQGLEHLLNARRSGRGAILLTFHGASSNLHYMTLGRVLGVSEIPTISHRIPTRQSEFSEATDGLSHNVALALNTEIAMYAQRRLRAGEIVNVVGDTSDVHGRRYEVTMAGRLYQVKAGFAELALNTGAAVLPHYCAFLPDGRPQLVIEPELAFGGGERSMRVEELLARYASFVTRVWNERPYLMSWGRIRRHLLQPAA